MVLVYVIFIGLQQLGISFLCNLYRYKIYIEGSAWSVSEKYILACDSVTLLVKPIYYDVFTRSLMPLKHYWPIKDDDKCRSIKYAVDWGNSHQQEVISLFCVATPLPHNQTNAQKKIIRVEGDELPGGMGGLEILGFSSD